MDIDTSEITREYRFRIREDVLVNEIAKKGIYHYFFNFLYIFQKDIGN